MKQLGVFLLPLDGMLVHRRSLPGNLLGFPQQFAGTHLYSWVERGTVRIKCLAQEHNTMSSARARTRIARSGDERTNQEAILFAALPIFIPASLPETLTFLHLNNKSVDFSWSARHSSPTFFRYYMRESIISDPGHPAFAVQFGQEFGIIWEPLQISPTKHLQCRTWKACKTLMTNGQPNIWPSSAFCATVFPLFCPLL